MSVKVIKQYCTKNPCFQDGTPIKNLKYLVVHSPAVLKATGYTADTAITGNQWYERWNKASIQKLTHGFIDTDGVHQFLPYNRVGWQVGDWNGNLISLGFELCEYTDKAKVIKVYENAVAYYAELCKTYNVPVKNVLGHKEMHDIGLGSNHGDPDPYFRTIGKSMIAFRSDVQAILNNKDMYQVKGNLNLWDKAEKGRSSILKMKKGSKCKSLHKTKTYNLIKHLKVSYTVDGKTYEGWAAMTYLKKL